MKLILIRGLPGSGKSTLAELLCSYLLDDGGDFWVHCEADQFFVKNGVYTFDAKKTPDAHKFCKQKVADTLVMGGSAVVANTFTRMWEMKPYIDLAQQYGAELTVITVEGNHGNIHGVPQDVIDKMRARWEPYTG